MSQCCRQLSFYLRLIALPLIVLSFGSCAKTNSTDEITPEFVNTTIKGVPIKLELALTRQEQTKGLMYRKSLPTDQGMLFIFKQPKAQSFWMKNTLIPLDIAYIDSAGVIREIYPMFPNNQNSIPSRSREIQFALEVNRGWYASKKIVAGDKIDLNPFQAIFRTHNINVTLEE